MNEVVEGLEHLLKPEDPTPVEVLPDGSVRTLSEQEKYETMWSHDQYRQVSPGEQIAAEFLSLAKPRNNSRVIDFGCGTGRGSLMTAILANAHGIDLQIDMLDFASNSLDPQVCETMEANAQGKTRLTFRQHDLTQAVPIAAEFGFCTDVMEHVPPEQVDQVLANILQAARHVFFQINCTDDACGKLIGHPLHLSVHEPAWWKAKLEQFGCVIHFWKDATESCIAYVTAWSGGQDVVDVGQLNIEETKIRENVRANIKAGWHQVRPHNTQSTEVMILGGGPSLNSQLDTIRRMRFEGAKLVTLNGAYNWALDNFLDPSATIVVDARDFNARFVKPVHPQTIYLIGSQCDPSLLQDLPRERTLLWHTTAESIRDILEEECPGEWFGVPGGSTVLLRAIPLLRMLGYSRFHLFGCDSCVTPKYGLKDPATGKLMTGFFGAGPFETRVEKTLTYNTRDAAERCLGEASDYVVNPQVVEIPIHHAYAQAENDGVPLFPATIGGRVFQCHAWQIAQAQEFMNLIRVMGDMFELQVHGDGLLSWILEYGAQVDIERELEEAKRQTPIA